MLLPLLMNLGMFGTTVTTPSGGGIGFWEREFIRAGRRKKKEIEEIVEKIAEQQVESLDFDNSREVLLERLEAQGIEFETRYLTLLSEIRESLIEQEIGKLLKKKLDEEDVLVMLLLTELNSGRTLH